VINKFRSGDIRDCYADVAKIAALGFVSHLSLSDGLQDLVRWVEKQSAVSNVAQAHQELVKKGLVV
jgi:nucleoside-diphosphate-sugar epimerase